MKKIYVKPDMQIESFVPNEYIAACTDLGTILCWGNSYTGLGTQNHLHDLNDSFAVYKMVNNSGEEILTYELSNISCWGYPFGDQIPTVKDAYDKGLAQEIYKLVGNNKWELLATDDNSPFIATGRNHRAYVTDYSKGNAS